MPRRNDTSATFNAAYARNFEEARYPFFPTEEDLRTHGRCFFGEQASEPEGILQIDQQIARGVHTP